MQSAVLPTRQCEFIGPEYAVAYLDDMKQKRQELLQAHRAAYRALSDCERRFHDLKELFYLALECGERPAYKLASEYGADVDGLPESPDEL